MANTKFSALTQLTAPVPGDAFPIIDDYGGSPAEKIITLRNALGVINGLTEDTGPDRTADFAVTYDNSAGIVKKVKVGLLGALEMIGGFASTDPADGTTYYFGAWLNAALSTTAAGSRMYVLRTGTITRADIYFVTGVQGTSEAVTMYLRKNNTTDSTLSSSIALNASPYHEAVTGLSIAVTAGDYLEFKIVFPTMATNPQYMIGLCKLLLE